MTVPALQQVRIHFSPATIIAWLTTAVADRAARQAAFELRTAPGTQELSGDEPVMCVYGVLSFVCVCVCVCVCLRITLFCCRTDSLAYSAGTWWCCPRRWRVGATVARGSWLEGRRSDVPAVAVCCECFCVMCVVCVLVCGSDIIFKQKHTPSCWMGRWHPLRRAWMCWW